MRAPGGWIERGRQGAPGAAITLVAASAVAAAVFLGRPGPAEAQQAEAGSGIVYQHFSFGEPESAGLESLSLLSVPVAARIRTFENLTLEVGTNWARGELTRRDGSASTITGFTDTKLTASLAIGEDAATLTAVAAVPTGKSSYSLEEVDVAGAVSADLLPFRLSNWGSGGGFGLRAATSRDLGPVGAALSVGYFRSGEFDPVEGQLVAYRPGDNLSVRAALDAPVGAAGEVGLQFALQHHGEDELRGTNLFRAGDRYQVIGSYSFALGSRAAGFAYGGYHRRDEGTHLQGLRPVAAEDLFLAGGGARFRLGELLLRPSVDGRILRRESSPHEGWHVRAGATAEWTAGTVTLVPTLRGHLGDVTVRPGAESGLTGFDLGLSVRFGRAGR